MAFNREEIQQLTIEEITGIISQSDKEYLHQIIAENQEAYELWKDMHAVLTAPPVVEAQARLSEDVPSQIIQKHNREKRYILIGTSSIVAILLITAISWYILSSQKDTSKDLMTLASKTKHVELKLANGQTVDLSKNQSQVQVRGVILNSSNKTLTYLQGGQGDASLQVPAGKDYKIYLSDSSEVWLNSASELQFPFTFKGNSREISIRGEAYIKITKDARKPFIVHLPNSTIEVLGTEFNVNTYNSEEIRVALVTGSIKMKAQDKTQLLNPGYEIVYTQMHGIEVKKFDPDEVLSWQQGIYPYYDMKFEDLCKIAMRLYGIDFMVDNPEINQRRFTGIIDRNKSVKTFLDDLKATSGIDYYVQNDIIHIK